MASSLTRRDFAFLTGAASLPLPAATSSPKPWDGPAEVMKVYTGVNPRQTWPYPNLDYAKEIAGIDAQLARLERDHPDLIRFTGSVMLPAEGDLDAAMKPLAGADALLVMDLTANTRPHEDALVKLDIPMLAFSRPLTGWAFMSFARFIQQGKRADMVASSDYADLEPFLPLLKTIHHMRHSKVLWMRQGESAGDLAAGFTRQFGTQIVLTPYKALKAAYDAVSAAEVEREADAYARGALKVIEPSRKDIQDATRFYLAALKLMEQEKANALTIDCLGGFRRGELPAYPCVAWSRLNDQGYYGVCEADLPSTMTQMLITSFSGRPGFVSDPTFDTSRNEVIHAHCVAATRMMGLGGKASPYILRTHMEDEKGVSVQVRMPEREPVTVAEFRGPKTLLVSTGEATVNIDGPRGCRTKIVTKVADAAKMAEGYTGGLHRVMFYGDLTSPLRRLARLTGIEIVKEI
jgi:hypothetical protein